MAEPTYKEISQEVLQKLDTHFFGVKRPKSNYKETEINRLLTRATDAIKAISVDLFNQVEAKLTNRKADLSEKLTDIISKTAGSLRRDKHGPEALERLLTIYIAAVHPEEFREMEDPIMSYRKLGGKFLVEVSPDTQQSVYRYIFYYWNHEENAIEIGLLKLAVGSKRNQREEWEKGSIRYFKRANKEGDTWIQEGLFRKMIVSKKVDHLDTISLLSGLPGDSHFGFSDDSPFFNSFRILVKEKAVPQRKIMMCSYTAAISDGSKPTSGIGIIARISDREGDDTDPLTEDKNSDYFCGVTGEGDNSIIDHKIPDEVTNILFDRRDSLREIIFGPKEFSEHKLFESFQHFPNFLNVKAIHEITGLYLGYHLQNDYGKKGTPPKERGALRTFILEIQSSGICFLLDDEEKHDPHAKPYFGFLSMKDAGKGKLLINMDREKEKYIEYHSWRLQFYLTIKPNQILEGVVSGFAKISNDPLTSPVRFKKLNGVNSLKQFKEGVIENNNLRVVFPSTFFKAEYHLRNDHIDVQNLLQWDEKAIQYFASINNNLYFNSPQQSLPQNFINIDFNVYTRFNKLRGNYYFISYSNSPDGQSLSKVKIQLRNFGEAIMVYPIDKEPEKFDIFCGRWEVQGDGLLLKLSFKFRKRGAKKVSDVPTMDPTDISDFYCHLNAIENIEYIGFMSCASLWIDYEKGNRLVAKRGFLFPAKVADTASVFPDNFIEPYTSRYAIDNLDKTAFCSGIVHFEAGNESLNRQRQEIFLANILESANNIIVVDKNQ